MGFQPIIFARTVGPNLILRNSRRIGAEVTIHCLVCLPAQITKSNGLNTTLWKTHGASATLTPWMYGREVYRSGLLIHRGTPYTSSPAGSNPVTSATRLHSGPASAGPLSCIVIYAFYKFKIRFKGLDGCLTNQIGLFFKGLRFHRAKYRQDSGNHGLSNTT